MAANRRVAAEQVISPMFLTNLVKSSIDLEKVDWLMVHYVVTTVHAPSNIIHILTGKTVASLQH